MKRRTMRVKCLVQEVQEHNTVLRAKPEPRPFDPDFSVLTTDLTITPQCLRKMKEHEGMMFVPRTQQQLRSLVPIFTPGRRESNNNRRKRPKHQARTTDQEIKSLTRKPLDLDHLNVKVIKCWDIIVKDSLSKNVFSVMLRVGYKNCATPQL